VVDAENWRDLKTPKKFRILFQVLMYNDRIFFFSSRNVSFFSRQYLFFPELAGSENPKKILGFFLRELLLGG
jgi:hypothetical protein